MIHAAITAVALSCCTTITLADDTSLAGPGTSIDFKGGSVAEYIQEVEVGFRAEDLQPNIILLPGTEGVMLPAISLQVVTPGDALAAIADYVYTIDDGKQVSVDFEILGGQSSIYRISGNEWRSTSRSRAAARTAATIDVDEEVTVSIIRVPESRMASVLALSGKVLDLAGISQDTKIVPLPDEDLILVSSTSTGQALVGEVVFEVMRPTKSKSAEPRSLRRPAADEGHRQELRDQLNKLAKLKMDDSMDAAERKDVEERFTKVMHELRRMK